MKHIKINTFHVGSDCYSEISGIKDGKKRVFARAKVVTTEDSKGEAERLATIIVTKRALDQLDKLPLPPTARASLELVHMLVKARYDSLTGVEGAESRAKAAIQAAKNSPIKAVRAVAAGIQEFLK